MLHSCIGFTFCFVAKRKFCFPRAYFDNWSNFNNPAGVSGIRLMIRYDFHLKTNSDQRSTYHVWGSTQNFNPWSVYYDNGFVLNCYIPFYSFSILSPSIIFYSIIFYFIFFYSILYHSILFYSILSSLCTQHVAPSI